MRTTEGGLRERHKAQRRRRILDATRELLRDEPESVPSAERIAERAAVAPATVYNLIGPREKIWEALAAGFMDQLEDRLAGLDADDPREVVGSTVRLFVDDPVVSRRMVRGWEESGLVFDRGPLVQLRGPWRTHARTVCCARTSTRTRWPRWSPPRAWEPCTSGSPG